MEAKRDSGLTAKQEKFAALLAQGCRQAAAYREAYEASGMKDETVWQEASRLAHDPKVAARVRELLKEVRIEQIDDARQAFIDLLNALERATRAENWTAVAQLTKMRMMFHGLSLLLLPGDESVLLPHEHHEVGLYPFSSVNLTRSIALTTSAVGQEETFRDATGEVCS